MNETQLNTIGYVLSRYGALTGQDLENLTHSEKPWQLADSGRRSGESTRIEPEWIKQYFRSSGSADGEGEMLLDSASVTQWLQDAEKRREDPAQPDSAEELMSRLDGLRARLTPRA